LGEIGEMQRKAAHADEHGGSQRLDQIKLRRRRMSIARADPDHADAEGWRAARPDLPGRMHAERKRDVAEIARADAHAGERAAPGQLGEAQVVARAWIEYRLPGRAARAPIF